MSISDRTGRVLTTHKLQALFDSGRNKDILSRRELAVHMASTGEKISFYAIEAWFKHTNSNYAIARESLHPSIQSYAIPRRRWHTIIQLFSISADELSMTDEDFLTWCFQNKTKPPAPRHRLFVCYDKKDQESVSADLDWLADQGYETVSHYERSSDQAVLRQAIIDCSALIWFLPAAPVASDDHLKIIDLALDTHSPILIIKLDESRQPPTRFVRQPWLVRNSDDQKAYHNSLVEVLENLCQPSGVQDQKPQNVVSMRPSIAVLPVQNLSDRADNDMLADGLTEDLITQLSRMPEFHVISKSTMDSYRHNHPTHTTIHQQLGVRYMLESSIRQSGQTIRITTQLVDALSGMGLWSERFRRQQAEIFSVQDDITLHICAHLEPKLRQTNIQQYANLPDLEAWQIWQQGFYQMFVDAPSPVPVESLKLFEQALEVDPQYALAHAGIATALAIGMLWGGSPPSAYPKAKHHAEIAFKLLPENSAVLFSTAMITFIENKPLTIPLDFLSRAVDLEPSNVVYQASLGYLEAMTGSAAAGVSRCKMAIELSPMDAREPFICYTLSNAMIADGDYEAALTTMARSQLFSSVDWNWIMGGFAEMQLGNKDAALQSLKQAVKVGARSFNFYQMSIIHKLWPQAPTEDKEAFLGLFAEAGIT